MRSEDGGPAFPRASGPEPRIDTATEFNDGMSLRDYFAGQALMGDMCNPRINADPITLARTAHQIADAMLKAREEKR